MEITKDYNYYEAVTNDVIEQILNGEAEEIFDYYLSENDVDLNDLIEELHEHFWDDDSITGNGSGNYFIYDIDAKEALCKNWDLFMEVIDQEELEYKITREPCELDVCVRCYILYDCINDALKDARILNYMKTRAEKESLKKVSKILKITVEL